MSDNDNYNKSLDDMYDDFWSDAFDLAQETLNKLKYNKENSDKLNFKTKEEYLKSAQNREKNSKKTISPESSGYFDEYESDLAKTSSQKSTSSPKVSKNENIENTEIKTPVISKEEKLAKLQEFFERVENAHLTDDSKIILKKMISYAQKFNEGIVKNYIPFNMRIYTDNDETLYDIANIIIDSFNYFKYMKNDEAVERSLFIVEDSNHITDLYNKHNSLIIFKDVDGLLNKDKSTRDKLLNVLETSIHDYSGINGITTIISDISREKVDELLNNNISLRDKIFDFELVSTSANIQEVYQKILTTLKKDYTVSEEFDIKLLDYITETFGKTTLTAPEYTNALIEQILFNQTTAVIEPSSLPKFDRNKTIDEIFEELNNLVGLDNVKQMLKDLVNLMQFRNKTENSLNIKDTNLHMVFLGNPGTGKTTVARMVAGILYNLKYIKQNKLIEVSAKDLIGQYVGQTAPKTMSVIEQALGGVLFIDEAYSLASKPGFTGNSFNEECIATLIQAMENYRDNLVVIFAGYSKEMDYFLKSNSGIVSRIGYTMEFKDYTLDELIEILLSMFKKSGFSVNKKAIEKARQIIDEYRNSETFGNARFVRNLYEKAIIEHATNTQNTDSLKALRTITSKDITSKNLLKLD